MPDSKTLEETLAELETMEEAPPTGGLIAKAFRGLVDLFKAKSDTNDDDEDWDEEDDEDEEEDEEEEDMGKAKCPQCGAKMVAKAKFCHACGAKATMKKALDVVVDDDAEELYKAWVDENEELQTLVDGNEIMEGLLKSFAATQEDLFAKHRRTLTKEIRGLRSEVEALKKGLTDADATRAAATAAVDARPQGPGRPQSYEVVVAKALDGGNGSIPPRHELINLIQKGLEAHRITPDEGAMLDGYYRMGGFETEEAQSLYEKVK